MYKIYNNAPIHIHICNNNFDVILWHNNYENIYSKKVYKIIIIMCVYIVKIVCLLRSIIAIACMYNTISCVEITMYVLALYV